MRRVVRRFSLAVLLGTMMISVVAADLQFTEVQYESTWDWIEIRNRGTEPIDLDGFVLDDDDGKPLVRSNISKVDPKQNTVLQPGQVGILFGADAPDLTAKEFREAWQVREGVPLIAVNVFPGLSKGGDHFGLWKNHEDYSTDRADTPGTASRAVGFDKALIALKYGEAPEPGRASISWTGKGDSHDLSQWITVDADSGGRKSNSIFVPQQSNSIEDVANPGKVKGSTTRRGLFITEVMYNPASSPDAGWEFVELVNRTGTKIDFSKTPFTFDDLSGNLLNGPNVSEGVVADGEVFVLFNLDKQNLPAIQEAWGKDVPFVPVEQFPALSNSRDTVALWSDFGDYTDDKRAEHTNEAVVALAYSDGKPLPGKKDKWPSDNGSGSIHLDLSLYPTRGSSWSLSHAADGLSRNAEAAIRTVELYSGGDTGSPGEFTMQQD